MSRAWTPALAAHLLRRTGFGCSWAELQHALEAGPGKAIESALRPPDSLAEFERRMAAVSPPPSESGGSGEVAQLWLHRMRETPWPLAEKMTLFWHDHFAAAGERVGRPRLMERRLGLLRRHALGRFDALLSDICRDPATRLAYDARYSTRTRPPRMLAAALAGRWTAGVPADDATARSLTGASVLRDELVEQPAERDPAARPLDETLRALLARPETPRRLVRRLYHWLASETEEPAAGWVEPLAAALARDWDIGRTVGEMLRSSLFFSEKAVRQRVKGPVEYLLGIARALEAPIPAAALAEATAALGQNLLEPPGYEGWAGGRRWLNRFTMTARANASAALAGRHLEAAMARAQAVGDRYWWELLLQREPAPGAPRGRDLPLAIFASAEFQLA